MVEVNKLVRDIRANAAEKGFHNPSPSFPEVIALIHSELSEALEAYRGHELMVWNKDGKPEGVAIELVDAVIRIMDFFGGHPELNLMQLILDKHNYNRSRPFKHGGKKI
jgi:hypothetical protein